MNRQNWEYQVVLPPYGQTPRQLQEFLDAFGAEEWELVTVDRSGWLYFKRPLDDDDGL